MGTIVPCVGRALFHAGDMPAAAAQILAMESTEYDPMLEAMRLTAAAAPDVPSHGDANEPAAVALVPIPVRPKTEGSELGLFYGLGHDAVRSGLADASSWSCRCLVVT